MSYHPTDTSERALVALIVAELTGRTGSDTPHVDEEHWKGDFIFENEWQSVRTKKDRGLKLKTPFHECNPGRYKIAAKVVDIFGNDTMKIMGVRV